MFDDAYSINIKIGFIINDGRWLFYNGELLFSIIFLIISFMFNKCLIIYWRGILYAFIDLTPDFTLSAWILYVRLIFITFAIILPIIRRYLIIWVSNFI